MAELPPTPAQEPFPTLTHQLYQLASGRVTSEELVRRSLHAIDRQPVHAQRVPRGAHRPGPGRRCRSRPQARRRTVPSAARHPDRGQGRRGRRGRRRPGSARRATCRTPPPDAEVVRRLRAAGAVIVGKTNTCELGQWPFTSGPGFGHTRNPWSRDHTPGGSSGGSAAAVAAGLVTAAIGSDGAGSVRIPAAWTHLVGIKPQRGRISTWPLPEAFNGITVNGVLARTVADAALVLDAASGNVDGDLHKPPPVRVSEYLGKAPGPLTHRDVDEVSVHRLPGQAASRDPRGPGGDRGPARGPRPHRPARRPRLRAADVVELPVPVHLRAAGLGGSPRATRRAGKAHHEQYAHGPAALAAGPAQGQGQGSRPPSAGSAGSSTWPTSCSLRPPRCRRPACTSSTGAAAWPPTAR